MCGGAGCFGWEYKGKHKDLDAAHRQLLQYAGALGNPPLLVVSDIARIVIRTNWTNAVSERHEVLLEELADPAGWGCSRRCWPTPSGCGRARPAQALTAQAAAEFAELARRLRDRGHDPQAVAHFVNRLVFCLFADDVGLLPPGLFEQMLAAAARSPAEFAVLPASCSARWRARRRGRLSRRCSGSTAACSRRHGAAAGRLTTSRCWSGRRRWIGRRSTPRSSARCSSAGWTPTSAASSARTTPTARRSRGWSTRWSAGRCWRNGRGQGRIAAALAKAPRRAGSSASGTRRAEAEALLRGFLDRLRAFRVLDPACGSGNFLYLRLLALKDMEHQAIVEAEALGLQREFPQVGPEAVLGIEINPYAAELARVSVWIGHIQWARRHGLPAPSDPVLRPLDTIECRDAVLAPDGTAAAWPKADAIVGNPPFLGEKRMLTVLGADYTAELCRPMRGGYRRGADLVCYWFEKTRHALECADGARAGLVGTNSIRGGANRAVLDGIARGGSILRHGAMRHGPSRRGRARVAGMLQSRGTEHMPARW